LYFPSFVLFSIYLRTVYIFSRISKEIKNKKHGAE
jgi:hypothetical protein